MTENNRNTADRLLEAHAKEAARILIEREPENDDLPSLETAATKHFLRWAMNCRLDGAKDIARRLHDFVPVADQVSRSDALLRGGKKQRDVIAEEFNAVFPFCSDLEFADDPVYIAFLTCLILMLMTIDPATAKRTDVLDHAKDLLTQLESFDTRAVDTARRLRICSEYFANYGGFRGLFLTVLPTCRNEVFREDAPDPDLFTEEDVRPSVRRSAADGNEGRSPPAEKPVSKKHVKIQSEKHPVKSFSFRSPEALYENLPDLSRTEDCCRIRTKKNPEQPFFGSI